MAHVVRLAWAAAVCIALVLLPSVAEACPFCAGRNEGGMGRYVVIGIMVATPFIIVGVTAPLLLRWIRSADGREIETYNEEHIHE